MAGAVKAARDGAKPKGDKMRAPNPKGQGYGGDGQAVEDGRRVVQWEPFLAARSPCQLILDDIVSAQ